MARLKVSAAAERTLEAWLAGLMEGRIRVQDLPLCVSAWLHIGEHYGRAARQPEIDRLEREANLLNYLLIPERERRADIEERLRARLANMTIDDLDELDHLLQHIAAHNSEDATPVAGAEHHARTREAA